MATSHPQRPPALNRDHARPRTAPAPTNAVIEQRLTELVSPATYALLAEYRRMGLRERILTLPVMVALVLTMIWRQVPSVTTLTEMVQRESLLWAPPLRVSQQALDLRLRCLPARLFAQVFHTLLPTLRARAAARQRPLPPVVPRVQRHFARVWIADATTLEALFRKVGLLRDQTGTILGGTLLAILDLATKLPVQLWYDDDANANEKRFLDRIQAALLPRTLLLMDCGFYAFPFFDWLTDHGHGFVIRARSNAAFTVEQVLQHSTHVHDRIIQLGQYRSNPCVHPVRLIEVRIGQQWYRYLTNVLDPQVLTVADVVALYDQRWRIEDAFLLTKRLLGMAYLWTGAANGIALQVWATWLLYAVLVDLSDAIAEELHQPLARISLEKVFRGLYHFTMAYHRGEATDPVTYLAAQDDLGIVKRRRYHRERDRLDKLHLTLNL